MLAGRSYALAIKPNKQLLAELQVEPVDFVVLNGSAPIEEVRRTVSLANQAPFGKNRLLWVEEAVKLNELAQNSLLKIVEEPPKNLIIVLELNNIEVLLPTLRSRLENKISAQITDNQEIDWVKSVGELSNIKERTDIVARLTELLSISKAQLLNSPSENAVNRLVALNDAIRRIAQSANVKIVLDELALRINRESGKE